MRDVTKEFGYQTMGSRLRRIGERMQAESARFMEAAGIDVPPGACAVLSTLQAEGPLTVGEIATALGVSQPGVTRNVRHLLNSRLVESLPNDGDQRRKPIFLTKDGAALVDRARADLWPFVEAAVREVCTRVDGSVLDQLDHIEAELDRSSLDQRATRLQTQVMVDG